MFLVNNWPVGQQIANSEMVCLAEHPLLFEGFCPSFFIRESL